MIWELVQETWQFLDRLHPLAKLVWVLGTIIALPIAWVSLAELVLSAAHALGLRPKWLEVWRSNSRARRARKKWRKLKRGKRTWLDE